MLGIIPGGAQHQGYTASGFKKCHPMITCRTVAFHGFDSSAIYRTFHAKQSSVSIKVVRTLKYDDVDEKVTLLKNIKYHH